MDDHDELMAYTPNQGTWGTGARIARFEDDGATVEVVAGLRATDRVIQDPPDSIIEGEKLTLVKPSGQNEEAPANPQPRGAGSNSGGKQ